MAGPKILDPQAVPMIGTDAHLPAVGSEALTPSALRQRFLSAPSWQPEFAGDSARWADHEPASAAVLIPLVMRETGLHVLLTRRTDHLRSHAGQISFPGGRVEAADGSVVATALRETEEEIGLPHSAIEVIGQLPIYSTVTNFQVTPVAALVRPDFTLTLDAFEVAEAFEVPMSFLMNPAHHQRHRYAFDGGSRIFLSMPWQGHFIWGATAAMLRNFYRFLSA